MEETSEGEDGQGSFDALKRRHSQERLRDARSKSGNHRPRPRYLAIIIL